MAVAVAAGFWLWHIPASSSAQAKASPAAAMAKAFNPASNLRIRVADNAAAVTSLLDPAADAWNQVTATAILLNRTPRIYQTAPIRDRSVPGCEVSVLRSGGKLVLRLQWDDATKNAPEPPPARTGKGGEPKLLYKRPTGETATFPDAAAVMVPDSWTGPEFPSLLMGDKHTPACLYYWSASRGAEVLKASGRATPQPVGRSVPHRARHENSKWTVTLELPAQPEGYPIAFAIWDGQFADRDGLKFFSIWYVMSRSVR